MSWKPINKYWDLEGKDVMHILGRIPKCLASAKTETSVLRLLSLGERANSLRQDFDWTYLAFQHPENQ